MPTKSYLLAFLSVCGVTHYVFIPADLSSVSIVGPVDAIAELIDLSNVAATTRLTDTQLDTLRRAFGMGDAWTKADSVCRLWERRFVFCISSACYMGLGCRLNAGPARIIAAAVGVLAAFVCASWYNIFRVRRVFSMKLRTVGRRKTSPQVQKSTSQTRPALGQVADFPLHFQFFQ